MEKIKLVHPNGKNGVSMDQEKYETLRVSFLSCLKNKKAAPFDELMADVETDLKKRKQKIEGKLHWNLFWVTLNLEATKEIIKDKSTSPLRYSIAE